MYTETSPQRNVDFATIATNIVAESQWVGGVPPIPSRTFCHAEAIKTGVQEHLRLAVTCMSVAALATALVVSMPTGLTGVVTCARTVCLLAVAASVVVLLWKLYANWRRKLAAFRQVTQLLERDRRECIGELEWAASHIVPAIIEGLYTEKCSSLGEFARMRRLSFPTSSRRASAAGNGFNGGSAYDRDLVSDYLTDLHRCKAEVSLLIELAKAFAQPIIRQVHLCSVFERIVPDQAREHEPFRLLLRGLVQHAAARQEAREIAFQEMAEQAAVARKAQEAEEARKKAQRDYEAGIANYWARQRWEQTRKELRQELDNEIARLRRLQEAARLRGGLQQARELQATIDELTKVWSEL